MTPEERVLRLRDWRPQTKTTKPQDSSIWKKRVEGLEASGQSCSDYARRSGVNANTLAGWR